MLLAEHSAGRSGSFFFASADGRFLIKTIKHSEFEMLFKSLGKYLKHLSENPDSLLTWYYGLYQMKCYKEGNSLIQNIYIVVMNNVLEKINPKIEVVKYDLKGSTYKRVHKAGGRDVVFKDQDFIKGWGKVGLSINDKNKVMK
jgi:1-phosphatidylinositol-4-phosphate 5-kinase